MSEKQFFVFGDSITYGAIDREGGWTNRLRRYLDARMLDSKGKEFFMLYNLGISGDNTNGLLARFEPELKARLDESEEVIVIFAIGINDSQYINEKENHRVSPADFEMNLKELFQQAKSNGASKVIFVGLTEVDESKTMPIPWSKEKYYDNESVRKYDNTVRTFAESNGLLFISMQGVLNTTDLADGLHPNTQGGEKMFEVIKKNLKPLF